MYGKLKLIAESAKWGCKHFARIAEGMKSFRNWKDNADCLSFLEKYGLKSIDVQRQNNLPADFSHLKHMVEILEESNIPVTFYTIDKFYEIFNSQSYLQKMNICIDDVAQRYLQYLEPFPYQPEMRMPSMAAIAEIYHPIQQYHRKYLPNKETITDWPNKVEAEMMKSLAVEQRRVLRQYYAWHFKSDLCAVDKYMYNYSKICGLRSLRSIHKTLSILEKTLEISAEKILRNFYLLTIEPYRLIDIIDKVPKIGSLTLNQAVDICPKILGRSSTEILAIEQLLNDFNIGNNDSPYRYHVFGLQSSTIRSRLHQMASGDMAVFLTHPRACELLYFFTKAARRLADARHSGFKSITMNSLVANEKSFQNFIHHRLDKISHRSDIVHYLGHKLNVTTEAISELISRHSHRHHVPLADVKDTTEALLQAGFSKPLILESLHLLLYPRNVVMDTLQSLPQKTELKDAGFENGFVAKISGNMPSGTKFLDKRLVLSLYYLERPYHFTGEGVVGYRVEPSSQQ